MEIKHKLIPTALLKPTKRMKKMLTTFSVFLLTSFPLLASAETIYLINPLGETDPRLLAGRLVSATLSIIGTLTLLMFVYAGVLWITAQGEPKKVQRGKDIMVWATLGLAVIAGAYVAVQALVNAFTTGSVSEVSLVNVFSMLGMG